MLAESRQAGKVIYLHKYFQNFSEFLKNHRLELPQHYSLGMPAFLSHIYFTLSSKFGGIAIEPRYYRTHLEKSD
jgi:hypothetical protein